MFTDKYAQKQTSCYCGRALLLSSSAGSKYYHLYIEMLTNAQTQTRLLVPLCKNSDMPVTWPVPQFASPCFKAHDAVFKAKTLLS